MQNHFNVHLHQSNRSGLFSEEVKKTQIVLPNNGTEIVSSSACAALKGRNIDYIPLDNQLDDVPTLGKNKRVLQLIIATLESPIFFPSFSSVSIFTMQFSLEIRFFAC